MFDNILSTVKEQIGGQLKSQTGLNDEQVDQSVQVVGGSTQEVVKEEASSGNLDGLMQAFGKGDTSESNSVISKLGSTIVDNLVTKVGLSSGMAEKVKSIALPFLVKTISSKFSGSGGGGASGLLAMFQKGGKGAGFGDLKSKLGGLGKLF